MLSFIVLMIGYVGGLLLDFFVINKGTPNFNLPETIKLYWGKKQLYILASIFSFIVVCLFYFVGEVQLPKDFKLNFGLFVIQGLRTSEFIVGFCSVYLFLVLSKFTNSAIPLDSKVVQKEINKK